MVETALQAYGTGPLLLIEKKGGVGGIMETKEGGG